MSDTIAAEAAAVIGVGADTAPNAPAPRFNAFISYKQATESRLAEVLRHELHTFAKPWYRLRAVRVFLDRSNLSGGPRLWRSIEAAVSSSTHFIYLASPEAADSPWVQQELTNFLTINPPERLIIVLAAGEIHWNRATKDFDWEKTNAIPRLEHGLITPDTTPLSDTLYHDVRWARKEPELSSADPRLRDLVATISSTLRNKDKDALAGRDVQLRRQALRLAWSAAAVLVLLAAGLGLASWWAMNQQRLAIQRLTRSYVANAMRLVDADDPLAALPWLGAAVDAERSGLAGMAHRERLAAVLRQTPQVVRRWTFLGRVRNVVLSRDGKRMAVVTGIKLNDGLSLAALGESEPVGKVQVWDVETGEAVTSVFRHRAGISTAAFSPDGTWLLTAGGDSTAVLWDLRNSRAPLQRVLRHGAVVEHAEFSRNGLRVMTVGGGVHVWNVTDGSRAGSIPLPAEEIHDASIDSTGSVVEFGDPVQLWRVGSFSTHTVRAFAGREVRDVRFTPDGRRLIAIVLYPAQGTRRNAVVQADVASGEPVGPEIVIEEDLFAIALSADGRRLLTVGSSIGQVPATLQLWDAASGIQLTRWLASPDEVSDVGLSADGQWAAAVGSDGTVRQWSTARERNRDSAHARLKAPVTHGGGVVAARFFPDAARLLTAGGREVRLWDLVPRDARLAAEVRPPGEPPRPGEAVRSRDGRWTARLGDSVNEERGSRHVIIHDARETVGKYTVRFPGIVHYLLISPNGRLLAAAGDLGNIWVWEMDRKKLHLSDPLMHGASYIVYMEFSPDSRRLVTVGNHARVWDIRTGMPLTPLLVHVRRGRNPAHVTHATFDSTGRRIATTSTNNMVRVWDAATGEPLTPLLSSTLRRVDYTWFSRTDRTLYGTDSGDKPPLAWSLAPESKPPGEARRAVELLSSLRIDETGALVPVIETGRP
jgi:WD40 repeat protein